MNSWLLMKRTALWVSILIGLGLIIGSWQKWLPLKLSETLGFVTGAACVYLVVKENIWNFPLGIANNIFFLVLFLYKRKYHQHLHYIQMNLDHILHQNHDVFLIFSLMIFVYLIVFGFFLYYY